MLCKIHLGKESISIKLKQSLHFSKAFTDLFNTFQKQNNRNSFYAVFFFKDFLHSAHAEHFAKIRLFPVSYWLSTFLFSFFDKLYFTEDQRST